MIKKYQVLGVKGSKVEINGEEYEAHVDIVELTDEEAAQPLAESKIALLPTTTAPSNEEKEEEKEEGEEEEDGEGNDEGEIKEGEEK